MRQLSLKNITTVLFAFIVYSCSTIFCKYASLYEFLSFAYILFLGGSVILLGVYAVLWQKVLSFMELNKAFLCKSITIVFILLFSLLFFGEHITLNNVIGAVFIIFGLVVLAWKK